MKILIIRFSSIGDVVLTTPVVRCLKKQLSGSIIHYLTDASNASLLDGNPYIDKVHQRHELNYGLVEELKNEGFGKVIDLQQDESSKLLLAELDLPVLAFEDRNIRKALFTSLKINLMPAGEHRVDRYMKTVASLGVRNDGQGLDHFIPAKDEVTEKDIPASHHLGFLAFVVGASKFTKKLPPSKWQEICARIDHPIILMGGPDAFHDGHHISMVDPIKLYNACGKFSLQESADLLRRSKLVVSQDTGLMHIAAALKKPVISIWGSTTPSLGLWPYYGSQWLLKDPTPSDAVQVRKLWCRPCTDEGRDECPLGHFKCMRKMDVEEVVMKIRERLSVKI